MFIAQHDVNYVKATLRIHFFFAESSFLSTYYYHGDILFTIQAAHVLHYGNIHLNPLKPIYHDNFTWSRLNVVYPFAPFICAYKILCDFYAFSCTNDLNREFAIFFVAFVSTSSISSSLCLNQHWLLCKIGWKKTSPRIEWIKICYNVSASHKRIGSHQLTMFLLLKTNRFYDCTRRFWSFFFLLLLLAASSSYHIHLKPLFHVSTRKRQTSEKKKCNAADHFRLCYHVHLQLSF